MNTAARPTPTQARSRRTEEALIRSALRLFRERGVDAVTTTDIAAAAGVAPATVNRRFGDKSTLVSEAFRVFVDETLAMLESAAPLRVPPTRGKHMVGLSAEVTVVVMSFYRANQALLQSAYVRALSDDEFATGLRRLRQHIRAMLRDQFLAHQSEIGHPNPPLAIDFALSQAMAMLAARHEAARLEVDAIDERAFLRELLRSLLTYLAVPHTPAAIDAALTARGL